MSTEINVTNQIIDINVTTSVIDVNVTNEIIVVEASNGAYPLPSTVYSVFGRTGSIVAQNGDYTTNLVTEGSNLYFTTQRVWNALSTIAPLSFASGVISISQSSASSNGYLSSIDWNTFNNKQNALGYTPVPETRTLTINGTTYDLSANRTWNITSMVYPSAGIPISTGSAWGTSIVNNSANWNTAYNRSLISAAVTGTTTKTLTLNQQDGGTITASWTDINTDAVTSVFGRTGAIVAVSGDYNTSLVTENTNLYFTNARSRSAISLTTTGTSGAATYDSLTGILNIPQYQGGVTSFNTRTGAITLTSGDVIGALGYTPVTNARTLSINGTTYDLSANRTWTVGTVTSIGLTMPSAFSVSNSPITSNGSINVTGAGTTLQFIDGTGALQTFPALTGYVPYTGATNDLNLGTHNLYANNIFDGFINVAASGSQIVLTIASTPSYTITGSGGQTIKLPDATTLPNGAIFSFNNNQSSGAIIINNNSNTLVVSVPSGGFAEVVLLDNSIAAGSWDRHFKAPSNVSWSTNTLDYAGSITSATWNGNVVAINRGGTGSSTQNFVDLTTTQTIGGAKTFSSSLTASSLIKTGGTSSQFLKADGSVDSSSYITLGSLSAGSGISYNNTTGVITSTITQYTDALARASISLTTTGTSGAATYNSTTGVLNIPQYIGGVTSVFGRTGAVVATEGDYSLTQLSDVTITSPTTGQVLKYNGTLWVNDTDANTGTVTSVGLSAPTGFSVSGSPVTSSGTLALSFATGYSLPTTASQTTWDTAYTNRITSLTTTGSSGASTLVSNTLNIPTYTLSGLGGQPLATNLTSLAGLSYVSTSFVKMTASGTFTLDTNTYYLASNPSGFTSNVGTVTSVGLSSVTSGVTIGSTPVTTSGTITIAIATATSLQNGLLSSTDWSTFNNKANALSGTINTIAYWDSATTIASLAVATYPSLTELSYVKGVTSAIQTQLNAKQGTLTLTTTGTSGAATLVGNTLNIPQYSGGGGSITLSAIGSSPNANAATLTGSALNLEPASASFGGVVTTGTQTFAGTKTFSSTSGALFNGSLTIDVPSGNANFQFAFSSAYKWAYGPIASSFNFRLYNYVTGTDAYTVLASNNYFGILTSTIGSVLQVNGNAAIGYSASTAAPTNGLAVSGKILQGNTTDGGYNISVYSGVSAAVSTVNGLAFRSTVTGTNGATDLAGILWNDYLGNSLARILPVVDNTSVGAATALRFYTNNGSAFAERMRITSGGNVGIGTTTIGSTLQVNGNAAIGYSASTAAPTNGLVVSGLVGVGVNTSSTTLQVNQVASTTKGIFISGDEIYATGNGSTTAGVRIALGVSRAANRQLWMGDNAAFGSTTLGIFRFTTGTTSYAGLDAVSGDGATRLMTLVGTETSNVGIGKDSASDANVSLYTAKLSTFVFDESRVNLLLRKTGTGTGDFINAVDNGGTTRFTLTVAGASTFSSSVTSTQYRLSALNTAPATSTSTGTLGEIRIDGTAIYVCTATNTWVRALLTTF